MTPTPTSTTKQPRSGVQRSTPKAAGASAPESPSASIGSRCRPECVRPTPAQAHCSVCHLTFGGVFNFDRHRRNGKCEHPASLDLVDRDGVWRSPMSDQARAAFGGRDEDGDE